MHKVKKGIYQNPPVSAEAQDLIRSMLTVDVTQRITIDQIKKHPCFCKFISPIFVFPSPLPFSQYSDSINIESISSNILKTLQQIGYDDPNDLSQELSSSGFKMSKVFLHLLSSNLNLEELPWNKANFGPLESKIIEEGQFEVQNNSLSLKIEQKSNSIKSYPQENKSDVEEASFSVIIKEMIIEAHSLNIWIILSYIEEFLSKNSFQWFYSDILTFVARSIDSTVYFSIRLNFQTPEDTSISFCLHKGDESIFDRIPIDFQKIINYR